MQEYYDHGVQFSIFIRSLEGRTYSIMVTPDTTIHSIKLLLKRKGFVQCVRTWWLCYGGKKLPDDSTLPDHGIQKDCTLCVQVSFLGVGDVFARASYWWIDNKSLVVFPFSFCLGRIGGKCTIWLSIHEGFFSILMMPAKETLKRVPPPSYYTSALYYWRGVNYRIQSAFWKVYVVWL